VIDAAGVTYRDATRDDAAALADFWRDTFLATFGHLYASADARTFVARSYGADIQAAELGAPQARCRLAFDAGRLIGAAKVGAFKLPIAPEGARPLELHQLYVLEEAKGTGVAAALMDWAIATARGAGAEALYLGVYQQNVRAQRFYARFGFTIVGEYLFEVGEARDPEWIMRAAL
jgi:ribosomal protein S18 acetylase RimI-like enzyme